MSSRFAAASLLISLTRRDAVGEKSILSATVGMSGCLGIDTNDYDDLAAHDCVVVDGVTAAISTQQLLSLCWKRISYADAMPITFSAPLDPNTVDADDFNVTLNTGEVVKPLCIFPQPATEDNEMQTFSSVGFYGDGWKDTRYAVSVDVVGDAIFTDGSNANGIHFDIPYENRFASDRVFMVQADVLPFSTDGELSDRRPRGVYPNHCQHLYGKGITHRVRLILNGGAFIDGINSLLPSQTDVFELLDASGNRIESSIVGLADLGEKATGVSGSYVNDGDNYFDICLDATKGPVDNIAQIRMPCDEVQLYLPSGVTPCTQHVINVGNPANQIVV